MKNWKTGVLFNIWHQAFNGQLPKSTGEFTISVRIENKITRNWFYRLYTENISSSRKCQLIRACSPATPKILAIPGIVFYLEKHFGIKAVRK